MKYRKEHTAETIGAGLLAVVSDAVIKRRIDMTLLSWKRS